MSMILFLSPVLLKYIDSPTYISSEIVNQNEAIFPASTICPESINQNVSILNDHGIKSAFIYRGTGSPRTYR